MAENQSGTRNHLRAALEKKEFFCTAELVLGRDHNVKEAETFVNEAAAEPDGIKVISVTDLPGAIPALPPEAFVAAIKEKGLTPIAHLTGKDGNRSSLESRLHALARMGVENILALTGDAQKEGFAGRAKPVYDLDSVLILWLLQAMRKGIEYNLGPRTVHSTPFDFFAGAVVNPYKVHEADQMMQFYKLQLKIAAGAQFIITQLGYNLRKLYELKQYMDREGVGHIPVLANVYVPTAKIAQMMQAGEVAGCVIPDELIQRLEKEKKPERLERAALMVAAVKDLGFAGAHIGGFNLSHRDFMTIGERAAAIGSDWRSRMDELVLPVAQEFYLLPPGKDGLSDGDGKYQLNSSQAARHGFAVAIQAGAPALHCRRLLGRALFRRPPEDQRQTQFLASWPVVQAAGAVQPLSQGHAGMQELRRLPAGPPGLRRLLHALVLQGTAQRSLRRLANRRHLRGSPRAGLHLERDLPGRAGHGRRSQKVRPQADSPARLVPGRHQRPGQPLCGDG